MLEDIKTKELSIDTNFVIDEERIDVENNMITRFKNHPAERSLMEYFKDKGYIAILGENIDHVINDIEPYFKSSLEDIEYFNRIKVFMDIARKNISYKELDKLKLIQRFLWSLNIENEGGWGLPDILVINNKNGNCFFCEVKYKSDKLRIKQALFVFLVKYFFNICDVKVIRINDKPKKYNLNLRKIIESDTGIKYRIYSKYDNILIDIKKSEEQMKKYLTQRKNNILGKIENLQFRIYEMKTYMLHEFFRYMIDNSLKSNKIDFIILEKKILEDKENREQHQLFMKNILSDITKDKRFTDLYKNMDKRKVSLLYSFLKFNYGFNKNLSKNIVDAFINSIENMNRVSKFRTAVKTA